MKKVILLITVLIMICSINYAADIWTLNFETAGGYTTKDADEYTSIEFWLNTTDYFERTDGSDIAATFTGVLGTYYFAGQDIDANGNTIPLYLIVDDIDIYGYSNLTFYIYLAEDDDGTNNDWDALDYVHVDCDLDNSGSWANLVWLENDGSTFNSPPYLDTNFDGTGDGAEITATFTEYSHAINTTGFPAEVDLRITFYLDSGDEDIAIDNLKITGDYTLPVTLSTFTAQYLNSKPTLYWQTQSETDNMGWFIYRNTTENFTSAEKISGMLPGHGTTTQPQSYIYEDAEELQIEQTYYYWLESVDYSGTIHHFDKVAQITIPHPDEPGQNVTPPTAYDISADPNPFSYTTNISFVMDQPSLVDVAIYNVKGQLVKSFNSAMTSQENETVTFSWNGKSDASKSLSNGVYLYSVKVNGKDYATKQLILMK